MKRAQRTSTGTSGSTARAVALDPSRVARWLLFPAVGALIWALALGAVQAAPSAQAQARMSERVAELAASKRVELVDVIVTFDEHPGRQERREIESLDGHTKRGFENLPFLAIRVPAHRLEQLALSQGVRFVSRDAVVEGAGKPGKGKPGTEEPAPEPEPTPEPAPPPYQATFKTANVPAFGTANDAFTGDWLVAAVLDSGVEYHADLSMWLSLDYVSSADKSYVDPWGHGTHVAGAIAGWGHRSNKAIRGVAHRGGILSMRVLDSEGRGIVSDVIAAVDWLLANHTYYNVAVANFSLGKAVEESAANDPLVQAVEALWDAGVTVVCSAGNYGRDGNFTITSPGNSRKVITVGSLTDNGTGDDPSDDYVSSYSSRGPTAYDHVLKPDLLAPGNRVVAAIANGSRLHGDLPGRKVTDCAGMACEAEYLELSGTSMAAAMVSGTVLRMEEKEPALRPDDIKARLMRSARKIPGDATATGAGVLDVDAALSEPGHMTTTALSPLMGRSDVGEVILVEDTSTLWGSPEWGAGYMWNDAYMWSDGFLVADGYMWSDAYLWSDVYMWSDAYLWSDGYMWSDAYLWSDGYMWSDTVIDANALLEEDAGGVFRLNDDQ